MSEQNAYVVAHVEVESVERISPSFMRLILVGTDLDVVGTPGQTFDQRIKVIFPREQVNFVRIPRDSSDWYADWLALPEDARGDMRTYSIRELRVTGTSTRLVIDIVRHGSGDDSRQGPGATWVNTASPGAEITVIAPRRLHHHGAMEFRPTAREVLLAGDETALPAIARILEDAPRETKGAAYIEIPCPADKQAIDAPSGVSVTWLPRGKDPHGSALLRALGVQEYESLTKARSCPSGPELVWETPEFSNFDEPAQGFSPTSSRFHWIAGESAMVTRIRRHLVSHLGVARSNVAFMGYWRAM